MPGNRAAALLAVFALLALVWAVPARAQDPDPPTPPPGVDPGGDDDDPPGFFDSLRGTVYEMIFPIESMTAALRQPYR